MALKRRTIIESPDFQRDCEGLAGKDIKRMDEVLDGVKTTLSTRPDKGEETSVPGVFGIPTEPWNTAPMLVYYRFTADTVELMRIIETERDED